MTDSASPARLLLPAVRAAYGAALLAAPATALRLCTGQPASARACRVVRVLAVRQLTQAAITALAPSARVLAGGAAVDVCHALSMLALAAADPALRRATLTDAAAATTLACAGLAGARLAGAPYPVSAASRREALASV